MVGIVVGSHPVAKHLKAPQGAAVVRVESMADFYHPPGWRVEHVATHFLYELGCKEIILFACTFSDIRGNIEQKMVERIFRHFSVPVYQTLFGTPVKLPVLPITEFV